MNLNLRTPCPACVDRIEAGLLVAGEFIHGQVAAFCPHNQVGAVIWVDNGVNVGWELFSAGSLEQAQRRVLYLLAGVARLIDESPAPESCPNTVHHH